MTRSSWAIAGIVAAVAAVLLVGALLVLGGRDTAATEPRQGGAEPRVATTTQLGLPQAPSDGSEPPDPYPAVPSAQVRGDHLASWGVRTAAGGRRLLVQVTDSDCAREEVRLRTEQADRVEVEIRTVAKPPPPSVTLAPDGSYGCMSIGTSDGAYAVIDLAEPLGERAVVVSREY